MIDLVLEGGTVIDGTGAEPRIASVAVDNGRIVAIDQDTGSSSVSATRRVDVGGLVVCPGFIDLHSHADYTIPSAPGAITQATQGVTTLVTGNCGYSPFPIVAGHADELRAFGDFLADGLTWDWRTAGEYADAMDRLDLGVNLALQVGHNAIRIGAMGAEERPPTDTEREAMRQLLAQAAADGVVGFSTGLIYAPGSYADIDELITLCTEAAASGLLYSTHMRGEGAELLGSIEEALTVARRSGVRLEISHLKASGRANWGLVGDALAMIDQARTDGVDVSADQYPYTASSTTLTVWLPPWALDGGPARLLDRLENDETRNAMAAEMTAAKVIDAEQIVIADTPSGGPYGKFIGQTLAQIADTLNLQPGQALVEMIRGQRGIVGVVSHGMSEADIRTIMADPEVAVASDSHTPGCPGRGTPHPRGLGTFTRVLGKYAREEKILGLPKAVRKMTALPAARLRWKDRGVLAEGAIADIAVFDPATVEDNATFADPWQLSTGVHYTFIGGVAVLSEGEPTGNAPGRVLRKK